MTLPVKRLTLRRDSRVLFSRVLFSRVLFSRVLFGRLVVATRPQRMWELIYVSDSQQNTEEQNAEADKQDSLLLKEMEEINSWARLAFQLYFGWFALQFTVNGVAMGWLFTHSGPLSRFAPLIFGVFILWNLMGTIATVFIRKYLIAYDLRIAEALEALIRRHPTDGSLLKPQSPVPRQAINTVFGFCAATMIVSLLFWATLEVMLADSN
jgi:hypothetical protein